MTYSITRYLNIRQAYFPSFSADGQYLAFLTDVTGLPQVWQIELTQGLSTTPWPEQLSFAADRVLGAWFSPAPEDGRLIFAHDTGGNEKAQLFLLSRDGAQEIPLTANYTDALHTFGAWSPDGRRILFAANRRHPALFDLYLQPLDDLEQPPQLIWVNDKPGFLYDITFSPDGNRVAFRRAVSSFEDDLFEVTLQDGSAHQLSAPANQARYQSIRYAPDSTALFTITDLNSDFLYIARLDLATHTWEAIQQEQWDCEALELSPNGQYLAYLLNRDGISELRLLDLVSRRIRVLPSPDEAPGVASMLDKRLVFTPDSLRLAFSYSSATRTSDIFIWDPNVNTVSAVTRSSHGGLPRSVFVSPQLVHYPTFDDHTIPAWFYHPAPSSHKPLPAVIIVHGGPEGQSRPTFNFLIQYLLHHGYAVLVPNVRGSTGYGKTYSHLDDVEKRVDAVADLAYAAYWLRKQPGINERRLAVYGGSYGGFMVLASLTKHPDLWAAGVNIVGISNFVTFLENTSAYRRAHREAEYGRLDRDRELLERISPLNHIHRVKAPLMVVHGANDPRVPVSEAEQLVAALRDRGVPIQFLVFDDEGHGLVKLKNKAVAYPAIIDFLNIHLK